MQKEKEKSKVCLEPKLINIYDRQKIEIVGAHEIISSTEKEIYIKVFGGVVIGESDDIKL